MLANESKQWRNSERTVFLVTECIFCGNRNLEKGNYSCLYQVKIGKKKTELQLQKNTFEPLNQHVRETMVSFLKKNLHFHQKS